jgi:hypothetical protein
MPIYKDSIWKKLPTDLHWLLQWHLNVASRLRDCGKSNWGFGLRNGRVVPLLLDGNSWARLEPQDPLLGKWPPKKLIGSFWPLLAEIHPQAASEIEQQVYWPVDGTQFDAGGICAFLLRRLAGLDEPQRWNPFC